MRSRNYRAVSDGYNLKAILTAALAPAGTITIGYPAGTSRGMFLVSTGHQVGSPNQVWQYPRDFELTFNAANITLTWRAATTLAAGTVIDISLNTTVALAPRGNRRSNRTAAGGATQILDLGSPAAASATAVCLAQAATANTPLNLNGPTAGRLDVPRPLVVVSSAAGDTTQQLTIRGRDAYGQDMAAVVTLNGTTPVAVPKAFDTITSITPSAATTGSVSVGTSATIGLPVFMPGAGFVLRELENGATASAGTVTAGALITPTGNSTDVRGLYLPANAPDGTRAYHLIVALPDPDSIGGPQFVA